MKLLLQKGQKCWAEDLHSNMHLYEVLTDKSNAIMIYESNFNGKSK